MRRSLTRALPLAKPAISRYAVLTRQHLLPLVRALSSEAVVSADVQPAAVAAQAQELAAGRAALQDLETDAGLHVPGGAVAASVSESSVAEAAAAAGAASAFTADASPLAGSMSLDMLLATMGGKTPRTLDAEQPAGDAAAAPALADSYSLAAAEEEADFLAAMSEQIASEEDQVKQAVAEAFARGTDMTAHHRGSFTGLGKKLMHRWSIPLANSIAEEQLACLAREAGVDRNVYGPLIILAAPQELAVITVMETLNLILLNPTGVKVVHLTLNIGQAVERHVLEQKRLSKADFSHLESAAATVAANAGAGEGAGGRKGGRSAGANPAAGPGAQSVLRKARAHLTDEAWSSKHLVKLGSKLLQLLLTTAKVEVAAGAAAPSAAARGAAAAAAAQAAQARQVSATGSGEAAEASASVLGKAAVPVSAYANRVMNPRASGAIGWSGEVTPAHRAAAAKLLEAEKAAVEAAAAQAAADAEEAGEDPVAAAAAARAAASRRASGVGYRKAARLQGLLVQELQPQASAAPAAASSSASGAAEAEEVPLSHDAAFVDTAAQVARDNAGVLVPAFRHTVELLPERVSDSVGFKHSYGSGVGGSGGDGASSSGGAVSKTVGLVVAHPSIYAAFIDTHSRFNPAVAKPMLVAPRPWTGPFEGGYLRQRTALIRTIPGVKTQIELVRSARMPVLYEALNALGATPWRINDFVLENVKRVWEAGGALAEIPDRSDVPIPAPPAPQELAGLSDEERLAALRRHAKVKRRAEQTNAERYSLRCDMNLKMQVAEDFAGRPFYYPLNLDFRGRAYPVPPHLNHMGADVCRGLMTFAHGKPLGERGLWWLRVHLSNLMGKDKISLDDRAAYTEAHLSEVFDSATRPLDGNGWWLKADSPWQALAACRELYLAYQCADPTTYVSCLPVHQDGSCNGLQHYAALGRDAMGGRAVNLVPIPGEDRPQDVYSKVLQLVLKKIDADAASGGDAIDLESLVGDAGAAPGAGSGSLSSPKFRDGGAYGRALHRLHQQLMSVGVAADPNKKAEVNKEVRRLASRFLKGHVDRKVVKQTVMTSVYGVTYIGAKDQIQARLKEKFEEYPLPFDELSDAVYVAAAYLAKTTLESLGDLFASADAIKVWLGEVARLVAGADQPMSWVTPLGLPVVQPYRREKVAVVKTVLQEVLIAQEKDSLPVSASRQRSAFPPNFVHSLDSTHMMLTALDCTRRGLTFTAVHDSYWTHACDVDAMSASLRDQFIALYSMPLLERLRESLIIRFPEITFPPLPPRGELDLESVRHSRYFFN